ncbi:MAG TPA: cyclic nucleotide-binding domain-containing protein [Thermoflexia bacterium]|nr:cyclic nucleotide-binding domain-containing protein [Thermoflexia bacterium]
MQYLRFLRDTDIFYGLSREHLLAIADVCQEVCCEEGDLIVAENAHSDELYIIMKGRVEIIIDPSIIVAHGQRAPAPTGIVILRSGQTFGEIGLVDRGLRSASACAGAHETRLLSISRQDLLRLCEEDYELGYKLMRNIAEELAFKVRNTDLMLRERLLWQFPSRLKK